MIKPSLISILILVVPGLGCPDLWISVGGSCYKTSPGPMSWYDAQQYCAEEGGYLIEILEEEEQVLLYSFLLYDDDYWIGLDDLAREDTWVWQESYKEANFTFWADGEPNNGDGTGPEDCAHLLSGTFEWNDTDCNHDPYGERIIHALCEAENI